MPGQIYVLQRDVCCHNFADTYIEDLPSFMMYSRNDPASTPNKMDSTIAIIKYAATGCDASEVLEALSACETAAAAASVFVLLY